MPDPTPLHDTLVCEPRFFDPQKFGVTIAGISGMIANAFTDERDARDWLSMQR